MLRSLAITSLFLCVRHTQKIGAEEDPAPVDVKNDGTCQTVRERIAVAIPSLKHIAMSLAPRGEDPFDEHQKVPVWWQVKRMSGATKLDMIPYDKAVTLRERLVNS